MSDDPPPSLPTLHQPTLGDRIRNIAHQLRQENDVQVKTTARILGAAAQIAQNHDRLIDEVVEMVEEDLEKQEQARPPKRYTVEQLQQQFKSFKAAKTHFNLKANSWDALASQLNKSLESEPQPSDTQEAIPQQLEAQRLEAIEHELHNLRADMHQVLHLLHLLIEKLP